MNTDLSNINLLKAIRQNLPEGITPIDLLMDILAIGKEAAYRRLRGDVPFTLRETALIAERLKLSLDCIANINPGRILFELRPQKFYFGEESVEEYKSLQAFLNSLKIASKQPDSEFTFSSNTFPQFPGHMFFQLFKYTTFKYMYENENMQSIKPYNEINVPEKFFKLNRNIILETMNLKETTFLFYTHFLDNVISELKYFSDIQLINNEDIELIKNDLHSLIDFIEELTVEGRFKTGNKANVFISGVRFDVSYSFIQANNYILSMIGAFTVNHLTASDEASLHKIKSRIQALKRVSDLISESGEMKRIQFINEQRKIINTL